MGTDPSDATYSTSDSDPVQWTNWYHAIAFCNKLSIAEGLTPVYTVTGVDFDDLVFDDIPIKDNSAWNEAACDWTATGYRLPTEMEWMWAAMGAPEDGQGVGVNTTGYAKTFTGSTGSNNISDYVWYRVNSSTKTHPVGTKLPNELVLHDMSGNVGEWCWDRYADYPDENQIDYRGDSSGTNRIIRGGAYASLANTVGIADRLDVEPEYQGADIGFRVVRSGL